MPLTQKEIEQKVIRILADSLNIDAQKIKPESKLVEDLGMDSFGAIESIFIFEEEFNIVISEEESRNFKTVKDILTYLTSQFEK